MLRKVLAGIGFVFLMGLGTGEARGQIVTCEVSSSVPTVDGNSSSELLGEILVTCVVHPSFPGTAVNSAVRVTVSLNTDYVAPLPGETGPVIVVNENVCPTPAVTGGTFGGCGAPDARFQDPQLGVLGATNRVEWDNVTFPIPGATPSGGTQHPLTTTLRIGGLRGIPAQLAAGEGVLAFVSVWSLSLANNVVNVALPIPGAPTEVPPPPLTPTFPPTACQATTTVPVVKAEGIAETMGDVILTCTRPDPAAASPPSAQIDFGLQLNTAVANAVGAGSLTDAQLVINENHCGAAASTGGVFGSCGAPDARFQDPQKGKLVAPGRLRWEGVSFPIPDASDGGPPFPSVTTVRISGIKANVAAIYGPGSGQSTQVTGTMTVNGNATVTVDKNVLVLAKPIPGATSNKTSPDPAYGLTTCVAVSVPPVIRAEGISELLGDIVLTCQNTNPPTDPAMSTAAMKLTVGLNSNVTNNVGGAGAKTFADAVLVVNENNGTTPVGRGFRFGGAIDPRFQDPQYATKQADDRLEWDNFAFPIPNAFPPAGGQFPSVSTLRITGIKGNASVFGIPGAATFPSTQVQAFLSLSGDATVSISTNVLNVAVPILGLFSGVTQPIVGLQCADTSQVVNLKVEEGFATAWKTIGTPTFVPSSRQWESGYFLPPSNNGAGATQGTRIVVQFSNVPNGVQAKVPLQVDEQTTPSSTPAILRYVSGTDANGAGGTVSTGSGDVAVNLTNGAGMVVYEVVDGDPFRIQEVDIPILFSWTSNLAANLPAVGFGEVVAKLGPLSDIHTASSAAPEPRFADPGSAPDVALTIQRCTTNLLFPYTSNQNGDDTRMVIANTSGLLPGDTPQTGSCTVHYHGALVGGGAAPVDQTSTPLASGEVLDFTLAGGAPADGIAGAPTFAGYLMAQCDFLGAEGTAIVNDGLEQHTLHRAEVAASGFPLRTPDSKSLLIPFASNQGGMDTEIVISNTTKDWLNTTPENGACTIEYFGQNSPAAQLTPVLAGGDQLLFTLAQGNAGAGIAGAPGFEGFVRISCGFSLLRGAARVIGTAPDAFAFAVDPILIDPPVAPLKAEESAQVEQVSSHRLLYKQAAVNKAFNTTVTAANYGAATAQCTASFDNVPGGAAVADINFSLPPGGFWKQDVSALASPFFGMVGVTCDQPNVAGSAHIFGAQGSEVILSTSYNAETRGAAAADDAGAVCDSVPGPKGAGGSPDRADQHDGRSVRDAAAERHVYGALLRGSVERGAAAAGPEPVGRSGAVEGVQPTGRAGAGGLAGLHGLRRGELRLPASAEHRR